MNTSTEVSAVAAEIAYKIRESKGAQAVFLAARHDANMSGMFTVDLRGNLKYKGRRCTKRDLAQILVYLQGTYRIEPSAYELENGLLAAAHSIPGRTRKAKDPGESINKPIQKYLEENNGSAITTQAIGESVFPKEFGSNRRSTEMMIAGALRRMGYICQRTMVNCERKYRWVKADKKKTALDRVPSGV